MARLKKCTEKDISMLLETDSDNDIDESTEYTPGKNISRNSTDTSDSDQRFNNNKSLLLRKSALQKERVSLRLKLRRSTEQSSYKIDSDSDNERPRRSSRNTKHHLKRLQDENQMPRKGARITKLPIKYSDYDCSSNSPALVLRKKEFDNKTKESFLTSFNNDKKKKENKTYESKYNDYKDNDSDSDCICTSITRSTRSNVISKNDKLCHVTSVGSNNDDTLPRIRTRSSKHISTNIEAKKDNINKVTFNERTTINSATIEQTSSCRSPNKRPSKMEYDSLNTTPKRRLAAKDYNSLNNTPKREIKNKENVRRSLSISDECKPAIHETEDEEKIDEVAVICKNTKNMSLAVKQRNKSTKNVTVSTIVPTTPSTPKSHVSLKHNALTPSAKMRVGVSVKPSTPLQKTRSRLHVSAVPKSLPCREEEFNYIYKFLEHNLRNNKGGLICISGVPGTGKTATLNEVVKCLKLSVEKRKLDQFEFVEINGMKLSEPRQAYVQILKQLSGKALTWEQAFNALQKRFNSSVKRPMTVLLVDELDLLCTKRQDVIYNILNWPTKPTAQLIVITIANTMDLRERVLLGGITSRLGITLTFQPYNHEQLQEIVITRLKDTDIFKSEAIQLIARKVSAVSGDARRALDICRRATEITEKRGGATVCMEDVNHALSEMTTNSKILAIKHCSKMEQIFLQAVCSEVTRTGVEEVCFKNVYKQFESLCCFDGFQAPNVTETLGICNRLGSSRLLTCEDSSNDIYQRMLLNVSMDDVYYALQ